MDYGRLAYIKAEELERAVLRLGSEKALWQVRSATVYPNRRIESEYAPLSVWGNGEILLVASVRVRAPQGADNAKVWLTLGGKSIACGRVTVGAGERTDSVLTAAVVADGETLGVWADGAELVLEEMRVLASGDGVALSTAASAVVCDGVDGQIFWARADGSGMHIRKAGAENAATLSGSAFDLTAVSSGVHVLIANGDELTGVVFSHDLKEIARVRLGAGGESVAIGGCADGLALAVVRNGTVYTAKCGEGFTDATEFVPLDGGIRADGVRLSKQCDSPVLFLQRGQKIFAKVPLAFFTVRGSSSVTCAFTV